MCATDYNPRLLWPSISVTDESDRPPNRTEKERIVTARIRSMTGRYCFHRCLSVNISGGVPGLRFWGGYLVSDFWGGYLVSDFRGGRIPGLRFSGGGTWSQILGEGVPCLSKGKKFWQQIWLDTCSDWEKNFLLRDPPPTRNSKKIAMATRRAVCLLRSRRRTFLFCSKNSC